MDDLIWRVALIVLILLVLGLCMVVLICWLV